MALPPPSFAVVRLREGYATDEVDLFVNRVTNALAQDGAGLTPEEIDSVRFQPSRLGPGYDMAQVDMWLSQAAGELRARAIDPPVDAGPAVPTSIWDTPPARAAEPTGASTTLPPAPGYDASAGLPPDEDVATGLVRWRVAAVVLPVLALLTLAAWWLTRP